MSESSKSRRSGLQAMSHRQVFGSENAADDDLLEECYVAPPGVVLDRAILIGKWGTGKTGLLLYRNAGLSQSLRNVDPDKDRIWYLDETGIQLQTLKHIEKTCSGDMHLAKRVLEELWTSEIIRTAASILVELYDFYGAPSGSHWKTLNSLLSRSTKKSVWDIVPSALGILISTEKAASAADLISQVKSWHDESTFSILQKCLADIKDNPVQPVVAIEPIETPTSDVEEKTDLAQLLVTCLLNVYYKQFKPSRRQLLRVEISIPWHRFARDQVGEPQKLYPFIGRFKWTKTSLRSFINKRIEWEFRRVRRSFVPKGQLDAWSALFPDTVRNSNTGHHENSFDYIVRHTQYRVRDLLRLTREAVEHEAVSREESIDDVLMGRSGLKLSERNIRAAVVKACKGTSTERVLEGNRRFAGLADDVELLRGIAVPFLLSDVKKRMERRSSGGGGADVLKTLDNLWNAGIIGVQITAGSVQAMNQLKASFESSTLARTDPDGKVGYFYVFEFATDKNIVDIINTFDGSEGRSDFKDVFVKIVVHPMLFEYIDARVNETHPIGI